MNDKKTSRGVYVSTSDSIDYFFIYKNLKFYFSSEFNMRRFKENICRFTFEENSKIVNKYKINIDMVDYLIFSYYESIEKRGYKIENLESRKLIVNGNKINIGFTTLIKE